MGPVIYAELLHYLGLPVWQVILIEGVLGAIGIAWGLNNLKYGLQP